MGRIIAAGLLALAGLMTTAVGVASADEVEVEGNYSSQAGCEADGPHVEITHNEHLYTPLGLPLWTRWLLARVSE